MFTENSETKDGHKPPAKLRPSRAVLRPPWPASLALLAPLAAGRLLADPPDSLLAVALPLLGGLLLAFTPPARSATGRLLQGISLVLLAAALFFPPGALLLAPLCYSAGLALGLAHDTARRTGNNPPQTSAEAPVSNSQTGSTRLPRDLVPAKKAPRSPAPGSLPAR